jgi:hypothetical protein
MRDGWVDSASGGSVLAGEADTGGSTTAVVVSVCAMPSCKGTFGASVPSGVAASCGTPLPESAASSSTSPPGDGACAIRSTSSSVPGDWARMKGYTTMCTRTHENTLLQCQLCTLLSRRRVARLCECTSEAYRHAAPITHLHCWRPSLAQLQPGVPG